MTFEEATILVSMGSSELIFSILCKQSVHNTCKIPMNLGRKSKVERLLM